MLEQWRLSRLVIKFFSIRGFNGRIRGMENNNEVCLWKTSVAEIDHVVEQMRKQGVKLPDKIDYDVIIHRYKRA